MNLQLDKVQAEILFKLIKGVTLNSQEKRELFPLEQHLELLAATPRVGQTYIIKEESKRSWRDASYEVCSVEGEYFKDEYQREFHIGLLADHYTLQGG